MLYTLILDEDNFVRTITHTENDDIELNLANVDFCYITAYQYFGNELILNEKKKAELIASEEAEDERDEEERKRLIPTWNEMIESQTFYTAMMTDTLLED